MKWLRYVIEVVVWERPHVVLNVDETSLSTVKHEGRGLISGRRLARRDRRLRPRDGVDRFNTRTTYLAVVGDCPALQPLLPQVILPKYTQHETPPPAHLATYAGFGFPFEFWHRSKGCATPRVMRDWATRVRSVVRSFNDGTWIVLLLDCSTSHLCATTIAHLRRLGYVLVMIPARLTWLLQILDAYVFGLVKKDMRLGEARLRVRSADGRLQPLDRMRVATSSIRRHVINKDWSGFFNKMGAGNDNTPTATSLLEYCHGQPIPPALPTLAEFAEVIGRPAHTAVTRRLHNMIIGATLELQRAPPHALPPVAAQVALPAAMEASAGVSRAQMATTAPHVTLNRFLMDCDRTTPRRLDGHGLARNHVLDHPAPAAA